jgi:hypothetical protein
LVLENFMFIYALEKEIFYIYNNIYNKKLIMKTISLKISNISSEITYYIGKDAKDNFDIIDKANPEDIWIHASDCSSCHVIAVIHNENYLSKKQKYSIIINGIHLCLQNTNSLHQQKNIEFSYTKVKNVVKTNKIGKVTIIDKVSKKVISNLTFS